MATTMAPLELPLTRAGGVGARCRQPSFRDGFVPRPRLVRALRTAGSVPLVALIAPAGYGKTTLLSEWALRDDRPFAWVTCDDFGNDPTVLLGAIRDALDAVEPPYVLVIDDAHLLHAAAAGDILNEIASRIPARSQLAVASRADPPLPLGRLRAHRAVTEIRTRDLAMTVSEARGLLSLAGLDAPERVSETLVRRTEGWPAGLYLAAVSLRGQPGTSDPAPSFEGDDSVVSDYFRDEFLKKLAPSTVDFLTRASVLDRLSGPVCDAVLQRRGSARLLSELARRNVMLVPLDRREDSFRFHRLFREMLRGELRRLEPDREPELHLRASAWHEEHGEIAEAIEHAIAAGDAGRSGALLWAAMPRYVAGGRNDLVQRWLKRFGHEQIAAEPGLALAAAHSHLAAGDLDAALRYQSAARRAVEEARRRTPAFEAGIALLGAALGQNGLVEVGRDAARAYELEPEDSPWRGVCCLLEGVARHLTGDRTAAEDVLAEAVMRAAVAAPSAQTLSLAQLALLAAEREDWAGAAGCVTRACAQLDAYGLCDYPTSALVYATSAFIRARRGQIDEAQAHLAHARDLLGELADFVPWYEVETRLALAGAALRLNDIACARELLADASRHARRAPDAIVLHEWARELKADLASASAISGSEPLTTAELRVLALLPTHLSFREIASRLYVTANTVKTQAHAVYRKFDASSRSEAVSRAIELGLLE